MSINGHGHSLIGCFCDDRNSQGLFEDTDCKKGSQPLLKTFGTL